LSRGEVGRGEEGKKRPGDRETVGMAAGRPVGNHSVALRVAALWASGWRGLLRQRPTPRFQVSYTRENCPLMTLTAHAPEVLVLVGPTAVGKSGVALELAPLLNAEIVSADSVQVYRYLDLGSAKPSSTERRRVRHHLIDVVDPDEPYDVVRFRTEARAAIEDIRARGKLPLIVGGTGFYVRALLREGELPPQGADPAVRHRLEAEASEYGLARLAARLAELDPAGAGRTDLRNPRRVIRALEIYETTGRLQSSYRGLDKAAPLRYNSASFALSMPREALTQVIDERVGRMITAGFEEEVQSLLGRGYSPRLPSLQALGYRQWLQHLSGGLTREEATALWKRETRRYARRQMTWFRREQGVLWFEVLPPVPERETARRIAAAWKEAAHPAIPCQGETECRKAR